MKILAVLALSGALVQAEPRIAFLRVHGNHTIPDDEVLRLAGVALGEPFAAGDDGRVQDRLMKSGKFETVDVRIRYRSLTETAAVALVLLVREKRSIASRFMVGPIFDWTDEDGVTIGARLAMVDLAGGRGSVAVPLSWGGKRQVGVEGRFGDAQFNFSRWRQVNSHFDTPDNRLELGGAYTVRRDQLRFEMLAEWSDVDFAALRERFTTFGAKAVFDTRRDPTSRAMLYISASTGAGSSSLTGLTEAIAQTSTALRSTFGATSGYGDRPFSRASSYGCRQMVHCRLTKSLSSAAAKPFAATSRASSSGTTPRSAPWSCGNP